MSQQIADGEYGDTDMALLLTKAELEAYITSAREECKLDSWDSFIRELKNVPAELMPALTASRGALMHLVERRDLPAKEVAALYEIIGSLIDTNVALRQHASALADMVDGWAGQIEDLSRMARRMDGAKALLTQVRRFARFERD